MNRKNALLLRTIHLSLLTVGFSVFADSEIASVVRQVPERGSVSSVVFKVGGSSTSFIMPPGWRAGLKQSDSSLILQPADYSAHVTVRVSEIGSVEPVVIDKDQLREQAKARFLEGVITGESETVIGAKKIISFEMGIPSEAKPSLQRKVIFVYFEDKLFEVGICVQPSRYASCFKVVDHFLASLRSE